MYFGTDNIMSKILKVVFLHALMSWHPLAGWKLAHLLFEQVGGKKVGRSISNEFGE